MRRALLRATIAGALLLLAAGTVAAAGDLYAEINRLRAGDGRCKSAQPLSPLEAVPALEQAAQALARGDTLEHSIAATGYRATRSSYLSMSGDGVATNAAQLIAERADCKAIMDPAFTDVGVHVEARELRVVAAAPFAPGVQMTQNDAGQIGRAHV